MQQQLGMAAGPCIYLLSVRHLRGSRPLGLFLWSARHPEFVKRIFIPLRALSVPFRHLLYQDQWFCLESRHAKVDTSTPFGLSSIEDVRGV